MLFCLYTKKCILLHSIAKVNAREQGRAANHNHSNHMMDVGVRGSAAKEIGKA